MRCIKLRIQTKQYEYMFNLNHIKVKEFFHLKDEDASKYLELQSIMKSEDIFLNYKAKPLGQLTYGQVAQIKRTFKNPDYNSLLECFKLVFKVKEDKYLNSDIVNYFYALNWIKEQVMALVEKEKMLVPDPDPDLEMAGVKKLSVFGEMSTLINLAQKFSTSPMVIETWTYNTVYTILLYQKIEGEVRKSYNQIKK